MWRDRAECSNRSVAGNTSERKRQERGKGTGKSKKEGNSATKTNHKRRPWGSRGTSGRECLAVLFPITRTRAVERGEIAKRSDWIQE